MSYNQINHISCLKTQLTLISKLRNILHIATIFKVPHEERMEKRQLLCAELDKFEQMASDLVETHNPLAFWLMNSAKNLWSTYSKYSLMSQYEPNYDDLKNQQLEKYHNEYGYTTLSWCLVFQIAHFIIDEKINNVIEVACGVGYLTYYINIALELLESDVQVVASNVNLLSAHHKLGNNFMQMDMCSHIELANPEMVIIANTNNNNNNMNMLYALNNTINTSFTSNTSGTSYTSNKKYLLYFGESTGCYGFNNCIEQLRQITNILIDNAENIFSTCKIYDCKLLKTILDKCYAQPSLDIIDITYRIESKKHAYAILPRAPDTQDINKIRVEKKYMTWACVARPIAKITKK
jgi:hypothetical protein